MWAEMEGSLKGYIILRKHEGFAPNVLIQGKIINGGNNGKEKKKRFVTHSHVGSLAIRKHALKINVCRL